jgi:hypothetical protein
VRRAVFYCEQAAERNRWFERRRSPYAAGAADMLDTVRNQKVQKEPPLGLPAAVRAVC